MSEDYLLLKWGTIKGYCMKQNPKAFKMLDKFYEDGEIMSVALDRPDEKRRKILCKIIDAFEGPITNDWTGETYKTKEQAKKYVMEYNQ